MVFPVPAEPETLGPGVVPFDDATLGWMEEDGPLIPRVVQGALQLFPITHNSEAALRVRVIERVDVHNQARDLRRPTGSQLQQRLGGLAR